MQDCCQVAHKPSQQIFKVVQYRAYMITAVIPAYNEAQRIRPVISKTLPKVDEVCVVDDGSTDKTSTIAKKAGATVVSQPHTGYIPALKQGFSHASGDIIVTLDADGEHDPEDIPRVVAPIIQGKADLVLGKRKKEFISFSEKIIGIILRLNPDITIKDHGTGFRALTKELACKLPLHGMCTCGILVLEAHSKGARITEVPIKIRKTKKKRKRKWMHIIQLWYIFMHLIRLK